MPKRRKSLKFVSRGGDKMECALKTFKVDVVDRIAADLGANVGGFTDCLLRCGIARVYAIDTAYGILDWRLRQDPRVVVKERTNALHVAISEPLDLIAIDLGWTPLEMILPRAISLLKEGGRVVALLKPQYEARDSERLRGIVIPKYLDRVIERVLARLVDLKIQVINQIPCSVLGAGGNQEFFLLIEK